MSGTPGLDPIYVVKPSLVRLVYGVPQYITEFVAHNPGRGGSRLVHLANPKRVVKYACPFNCSEGPVHAVVWPEGVSCRYDVRHERRPILVKESL